MTDKFIIQSRELNLVHADNRMSANIWGAFLRIEPLECPMHQDRKCVVATLAGK